MVLEVSADLMETTKQPFFLSQHSVIHLIHWGKEGTEPRVVSCVLACCEMK